MARPGVESQGRGTVDHNEGGRMKRIAISIVGVSPLLQHAFGNHGESDLPGAKGARKTRIVAAADELSPREVADKAAYRNPRGEFILAGTAILRLVREAGANHKLKGTRKSAKFLVPSAVFPVSEDIVITNGD